jgi:hypothetical protein
MKKEKKQKEEIKPPEPKEEPPSLVRRIIEKRERYQSFGMDRNFRTAQGRRIFGFDPDKKEG